MAVFGLLATVAFGWGPFLVGLGVTLVVAAVALSLLKWTRRTLF